MHKKSLKFISIFIGVILIGLGTFTLYHHIAKAQEPDPAAVAARQAQLQAELDQVLKDIAAQQSILSQEQAKGKTLEGDIAILNAKIREAQLKIKARQLAIEGLGKDINKKTEVINQLTGKIDDTRDSLAQLVRKTNEMDAFTLADVVLSDKDISAFFY